MPFLMGAPIPPAGKADVLWDFDFTTLSTGGHSASTFLSETAVGNPAGLTFTRASVSMCQTDPNTLDGTPGVDVACIGNAFSGTSKKGLVIQPRTISELASGAARNQSALNPGSATTTINQANGPDGASMTADRVVATTTGGGQQSNYVQVSDNSDMAVSAWFLDNGSTGTQMTGARGFTNDTGTAVLVAHSGLWQRGILLRETGAIRGNVFSAVDARDFHSVGGQTGAIGHDVMVDLFQFERTQYATETIVDSGTVRCDDRMTYPTGSDLVASNGQVRFYAKFIPRFASAFLVKHVDSTAATTSDSQGWLCSWGTHGTNFIKIFADNKIRVRFNTGTLVASTNAMSFSAFDVVEIFVAAGSGVASVAKYQVNGGGWVDLVLGSVSDVPNPGSSLVRMFHSDPSTVTANDTGQPPIWLQRLSFYKSTGAPAGV